MSERLYAMPFNRLYPLYLAKVTKKKVARRPNSMP